MNRQLQMPFLLTLFVILAVLTHSVASAAKTETAFKLYDLDDHMVTLQQVIQDPNTKMLVIDFFSMSCAPCKRAMPRLSDLQKMYHKDGLRVVVVAIPASGDRNDALEKIKDFFGPLSVSFPVAFDKYSLVAKQYGVTNGTDAKLPQSFVIDTEGVVVSRFEEMDPLIKAIEARFGK